MTSSTVSIEDTREGDGKKKRAKAYLVPKTVKRTVGIASNILWDNPEYALGIVTKGKPERVALQHQAFVTKIEELGIASAPAVATLLAFLARPTKEAELERFQPQWDEIKETGAFLSFKFAGATEPIFRTPSVIKALSDEKTGDSDSGLCLVTGNREPVERLHASIKGVRDANSTGANIVGFNLEAFCSFGKSQGENAPIGQSTAFAYTTALIKACLNRSLCFSNPTNEREITVSLDPANTNIGYLLGRLFAALEKIQADAQGSPNATIRDRFYGSASGTPATVFGTLMRMKNHHLAKLQPGLRIVREQLLGEILSGVADFPAHLALDDQGRFAIGYYHQMQDFFTKKSDKE